MNSRLRVIFVTVSTCLAGLLLVGIVVGKSAPADNTAYRHLSVYTEVLSRIKSDYVEEPDMKSVTLGALNGLLESVDPFASYLNSDQYKEYLKRSDADKGSTGLILSKRFGYVGVVDAIPGSPAAKAGLTTGDILETINGVSTRDMPLAYASLLLKGKPGTAVEVTVLAMRNPDPKKESLTRTVVNQPAVTSKMLQDQTGYIQVESLAPGKALEVSAAYTGLQKQGAKRLVLDLRHCASGSPEEGIALANLFLDKGLVTYLQGQKVPRKDFQADPSKALSKLPMVVITNRGTANGAEIAAAALLENKRAEVVGERTYGDAAVRQALTMDDGGAIILSVAKYYAPASGKAIQDSGVTPSVAVAETEGAASDDDDNAAPQTTPEPQRPGEDNLLKKALEVLFKGAPQVASAPSPGNQPGPGTDDDIRQ